MFMGKTRSRWQKRFYEYCNERRGSAAVEFALVAGPFFFLVFGLLELCMVFIVATVLEHAANETARQVRTGAFQGAASTQADFASDVCANMLQLFDCQNSLLIHVQTFTTFADVSNADVFEADGTLKAQGDVTFDAGGADDIVIVRVFFEWDLITPILSSPLANLGSGTRIMQATVAFKNEPF